MPGRLSRRRERRLPRQRFCRRGARPRVDPAGTAAACGNARPRSAARQGGHHHAARTDARLRSHAGEWRGRSRGRAAARACCGAGKRQRSLPRTDGAQRLPPVSGAGVATRRKAMSGSLGRRDFLKAGAAAGALALLPRSAVAADPLVVATFPGTWNEAHRDVLAPYFRKKTGADVTQTILLATDQVAKLR